MNIMTITYMGEPCVLHAAWAEKASGPGWANSIYWAVISPVGGPKHDQLEKVCIQPDDQTNELRTLLDVSATMHKTVLSEVARALDEKREGSIWIKNSR